MRQRGQDEKCAGIREEEEEKGIYGRVSKIFDVESRLDLDRSFDEIT